jgi:succinate dehydrogenase assembly factor 1
MFKVKKKTSQEHFKEYVSEQFRKNAQLSPKEFSTIEYLIRQGRKQLELLKTKGISDIHRRNP